MAQKETQTCWDITPTQHPSIYTTKTNLCWSEHSVHNCRSL